MDILDKYDLIAKRHSGLLEVGEEPFGLRMERVLSATEAMVNGRKTILAGTNNYLGLTFDPECIAAGVETMRSQGTGTTGSRIANGSYAMHQDLEAAIAKYLNRKHAIVFSTGYQANLGMLAGLAGPHDTIFMDADSHSSIYDGVRLSGAKVIRFRHNDAVDLDRRLARAEDDGACKLIVVEGIYSMLGDKAPMKELAEVKRRHGAYLLVDEAHSLGVLGEHGRGAAEEAGVEEDVDFVVGTFSKSLGAIGGYGASNHPKLDVLRFNARAYMYTASCSPSSVATVTKALERMQESPELQQRLWSNANTLYDALSELGYEICSPASPILAVRLTDEATAVWVWNRLLQSGIYVNLALPPGTPNGACLLRCSLSAAHSDEQIEEIRRQFAAIKQDLPLASAEPATSAVAAQARA
jgi:8-amino-7-oxononanoate synthase